MQMLFFYGKETLEAAIYESIPPLVYKGGCFAYGKE